MTMNKHDQMFAIMDSLTAFGVPHLAKMIVQAYWQLDNAEADAVYGTWVAYKKEQFWRDHKQFLSPEKDLVQEFFKGGDSIDS